MISAVKQSVILCEGYDDRSFWKGWLLSLGCSSARRGGSGRVIDSRGEIVAGGRYLFHTSAGSDVIVEPFHGRSKARRAVEDHLGGLDASGPDRVLLNLDSDAEVSDDSELAWDCIRGIARSLGAQESDRGPFRIGGSTLLGLMWECSDSDDPELPRQQTLERLVTASIRAAHPERGPAVRTWLEAEPRGEAIGKSYGYSYLAKWYPRRGPGDFYEAVWEDEPVRAELQNRLTESGAWGTVEALLAD